MFQGVQKMYNCFVASHASTDAFDDVHIGVGKFS